MNDKFEMVAKTFQGLEDVLAEELRSLGAENVMPGKRMVAFEGNKELLYRANLCCRTALRILKPFFKFTAKDADSLYEQAKEYDWSQLLTIDKTFQIDTVAYSDEFSHSRFVTYRIKDAIVDWFKDRYGADKRPGVRLVDADVMINVHISGTDVTLSLDSSGESLHKRGYRVAQTEAPINEVLAAGILLRSGYRGDCPLVDPMCGSGTFLIEAAMIAANINPGIYRRSFAFERWKDFDADLFDSIFNDDSAERDPMYPIVGADISPKAIDIARENIKSAGMAKYISLEVKPISRWNEAPQPAGILVTNPPYGERISAPDMDALYATIGNRLKNVFQGYHVWIIGYRDEYFAKIGLAASEKVPVLNGALECELREYVIFEGDKKSFLKAGGKLKNHVNDADDERATRKGGKDRKFRDSAQKDRKFRDGDSKERRFKDKDHKHRDDFDRSNKFKDRPMREDIQPDSENPLAVRRNPYALRSLQGKSPSLPPQKGPIMRSRGWKKK
jgi:putative N6-adenine-specific DNA methylase